MQARVGAMDELLQSGVLEDVGGDTDDIQEELDEAASAADVDRELAALKAKLASPPSAPELTSGDLPAISVPVLLVVALFSCAVAGVAGCRRLR